MRTSAALVLVEAAMLAALTWLMLLPSIEARREIAGRIADAQDRRSRIEAIRVLLPDLDAQLDAAREETRRWAFPTDRDLARRALDERVRGLKLAGAWVEEPATVGARRFVSMSRTVEGAAAFGEVARLVEAIERQPEPAAVDFVRMTQSDVELRVRLFVETTP